MEQNLPHTVALLAHTPAALDGLLRDLPEEWTHRTEGKDTWTAFEVVGHLIHADRTNWLARTRRILESGELREFDSFNRLGQIEVCRGKSMNQLLDEFASVRAQSIAELRAMNLTDEQLALRGRHPGLGVVTLAQLLATWASHDLTHLHQVSRILASQYREAVGPFAAYLGVMRCNGHGG
jgi:hypothetical protein